MNVTIIGTGNMARGIGTRVIAGGNNLEIVGQDAAKAAQLAAQLRDAAQHGATITTASTGDALTGEVVVLAVPYEAAAPIVAQRGEQLRNKIIVDITNPIDWSTMEPVTAPGTSGTEQIAQAVPNGAQVVKAFNTTFAGTLVAGQVGGQPLDVFIAGDDAQAKATVAQLINAGGLRAIDAGPLHHARQLEGLGLLHITLQNTLNTGFGSAVKILDEGTAQGAA